MTFPPIEIIPAYWFLSSPEALPEMLRLHAQDCQANVLPPQPTGKYVRQLTTLLNLPWERRDDFDGAI
jgi:hypothetical protein